ncbi:unnamed protein product [Rotaria socialis]|uniref:Uncharacterized protein n=1 Tax=Rotaria socialis TaxID=392032 RepID=A0A820JTL3_9BILA|nr:unnamed protein product [Rotaria socialis]CAF3379553.1 unnamed protein product [Rotaria socialis]CAF3451981.1 unnamed protein product [Rotaria socialis]CAF4329272.1 unnamed protein product [Rotaria socialis]CAF4675887.1 unnamed protein product [Rotaria socialis]
MNVENQASNDIPIVRLKLVKYLREAHLRTHSTYIFYFMLIYWLISSLIRAPIFLIGDYLQVFSYYIDICEVSAIHYLTINIGMITSLLYTSIERLFLLFHKTGLLTWYRQLLQVM